MSVHRTEKELKQIALDLARDRIFCDWQIQNDEDVPLIFQCITLMTEAQNLELQTKDIGMLFEYKTAAVDIDPETGIPVFVSMNILTTEEAFVVSDWFARYKTILDTDKEVEI